MTWHHHRNRGEILRDVAAYADLRRDGRLPMHLPGVRESFDDEQELLGALQLRWHTRLSGRFERELAGQPLDLEGAAVRAWRATAAELPGIRAIIDHHRADPLTDEMARTLRVAEAKERIMLAVMAGKAGINDPEADRVGARIEELARAGFRPPAPSRRGAHAGPGLFDRLRAVLAA